MEIFNAAGCIGSWNYEREASDGSDLCRQLGASHWECCKSVERLQYDLWQSYKSRRYKLEWQTYKEKDSGGYGWQK